MNENKKLKLCYFGTFEEGYPRNSIFIGALRNAGADVAVINHSIKTNNAKQLGKSTFLIQLAFRFMLAYLKLGWELLFINNVDAIIIGYPAYLDIIVFGPIIKLKKIPLFFNPLVSLHDTFVGDRKLVKENSFPAKALYYLDKLAFSIADAVFWDTKTHKDYIASFFRIDARKFFVVPVGAETEFFREEDIPKAERFQVLYVGKYIPLHGIDTIIEAAKILRDDDIKFILVGTGQDYEKARRMTADYTLENIEFIDWLGREDVFKMIKRSHVILGIFKKGGKAGRVVPNKVFDAMAGAGVVVTEDSTAMREWFNDGEDVFLVEPGNPDALAEKIRWVKLNYNEARKVAKKGKEKIRDFASEKPIGRAIVEVIQYGIPKGRHT